MNHPSIFDAPPYQSHSATSCEAAESMRGKTANLREQVLFLLQREGLTDEQIADRLKLSGNTARPRRIELVQRGLVGAVGTIKGSSGRSMQIWRAL